MVSFRSVPDEMREREPIVRGREPKSELSKALLAGGTYFIPGARKTWGSIYNLARNHNKVAHVKRTVINGESGTLIWFESEAT
jgi:hypothetical protein